MPIKPTPKKTRSRKMDYVMLTTILVLFCFGMIELYSASTVVSYSNFHINTYYLSHQLLYGGVIGLLAMWLTSKIDYHFWQKWMPVFLIGALLLLVAVLVPGLSYKVGDSGRWISIHGHNLLQPSEVAKLALIIYLASWFDRRSNNADDFYSGYLPLLIVLAIFAGLVFKEPDIGTMLVISGIGASMIYVGGSKLKYLGWTAFVAVVVLAILIKFDPSRMARLTTFLNPSADPQGAGYQINQALVAIGSGGLWGFGYGNSRQKYNYLPEVIGDSIFAVVVEELGFIRACGVIALYGFFSFRGIAIAKAAPDTFGKMMAIGIVAWIAIQAFINIGAIIGLLPLTGIPLPLISYGSSALIVNLAAMGILLNISKA